MRWPMRDARLWDGFRKKHAYKKCPYEKHACERRAYERCPYERHAYEMADGRDMPIRDKPMRWPMGDTRLWERHAYAYKMTYGRGMPMRWPL
jgi:hypothetical protein